MEGLSQGDPLGERCCTGREGVGLQGLEARGTLKKLFIFGVKKKLHTHSEKNYRQQEVGPERELGQPGPPSQVTLAPDTLLGAPWAASHLPIPTLCPPLLASSFGTRSAKMNLTLALLSWLAFAH